VASVVSAARTTFLIKEKKKEELIFLLAKRKVEALISVRDFRHHYILAIYLCSLKL
jgi:hypothetical protein